MRYLVLACDYDGTIATHGRVDPPTVAALERCRQSGRKLVLVTGRELPELGQVFPRLDLFEWIVAENGALLYRPETQVETPLVEPPSADFVSALRTRGVAPISVGRVIVATWHPHENVVMETIRDFGLELQVIFNKGAVMILPTGVNKATGLKAALAEMGLSPHNAVGVGDAENDHALLGLCEASAAVANALPTLKDRADLVCDADHGAGVAQLIDIMIADDLAQLEPRLTRHHLLLGHDAAQQEVRVPPATCVLAAGDGPSAPAVRGLTARFIESAIAARYQVCLIDGAGKLEPAANPRLVTAGTPEQAPDTAAVLKLLEKPQQSVIVNFSSASSERQAKNFAGLLTQLLALRARAGRPHWIVIDDAAYLTAALDEGLLDSAMLQGCWFVTRHPERLARKSLQAVTMLFSAGEMTRTAVAAIAGAHERPAPGMSGMVDASSGLIYWRPAQSEPPQPLRTEQLSANRDHS